MAEAVWAIIPARGGSKGVTGKNLRKVAGRTLIARAVEAAKSTSRVTRVFVSTDDDAIAAEARRAGAEIVPRPAQLAGDAARSEDALLHALDWLERGGGALPPAIVFVQCTSPFVTAADIDGTIAALAQADSALTVTHSHSFLWRRADAGAQGVNHDPRERVRRQDRVPEFLETGGVYAMRTAGFRTARRRFFGKTTFYEVPASRALEVDTAEDLAMAQALVSVGELEGRAAIPDPLGGVVFDFDGVMTDDTVLVDENGVEAVWCSRADGLGIEMLRGAGIRMAVLSRERNNVVAQRCAKLGLECHQACDNKLIALQTLCAGWGTAPGQIIYVGNDVNDLECLSAAGLAVVVADAHASARAAAGLVLSRKGGRGAVRELCDMVLAQHR